jgi:hypothetical protein
LTSPTEGSIIEPTKETTMKLGKRTWYDEVLDIPEATVGEQGQEFTIRHMHKAPGEPVMASNMRTALFRGQSQDDLRYDRPTRWHELLENGGRWMSDLPIEQIQIDEELSGVSGHVLVGGLGLGYAAVALAAKHRVRSVTVVELQQAVIDLVAPHIAHRKITVVQGDLFEYLRTTDRLFTYGFYDIWASDGEHTFHETVMPLRQLSRGKVGQVRCWNEQVMRGQLAMGIQSRLLFLHGESGGVTGMTIETLASGVSDDQPGAVYANWSRPFWQWVKDTKPSQERASVVGRHYAQYYGMSATVDVALLADFSRARER